MLITGFMGAGKTTVAAALAARLACRMIDLDQFITERLGRSPQSIIDESSEAEFRRLETGALVEALQDAEARVIALGGGTWTIEQNRALVKEAGGLSIWLDAPFELCWQRIKEAGDARPLARWRTEAQSLFDARRVLYETAAMRVQVDEERSADEIAAEIARALLQ